MADPLVSEEKRSCVFYIVSFWCKFVNCPAREFFEQPLANSQKIAIIKAILQPPQHDLSRQAEIVRRCLKKQRLYNETEEPEMEFTQVVKNRYSCKKFSDRAVEPAKLEEILEAGRAAPTAKNLQEQRIYVVQSQAGLEMIDRITPCRYGAPVCVIVAFDTQNMYTYPGEKHTSGVEDAAIVATHMLLAAANAGVDSCWLNCFDPDKLAKELNLPDNEEVLMILDLGYAAEGAAPLPNHFSRKALAETVSYR